MLLVLTKHFENIEAIYEEFIPRLGNGLVSQLNEHYQHIDDLREMLGEERVYGDRQAREANSVSNLNDQEAFNQIVIREYMATLSDILEIISNLNSFGFIWGDIREYAHSVSNVGVTFIQMFFTYNQMQDVTLVNEVDTLLMRVFDETNPVEDGIERWQVVDPVRQPVDSVDINFRSKNMSDYAYRALATEEEIGADTYVIDIIDRGSMWVGLVLTIQTNNDGSLHLIDSRISEMPLGIQGEYYRAGPDILGQLQELQPLLGAENCG